MAMGATFCAAVADAMVMFLGCSVTSYQGAQEGASHYALLVTTSLLSVLLFTFDLLCGVLGGASFNPTDFAVSYAAGLDSPSLFSVALRFSVQAVGVVGGALAISELMQAQYKHTLAGPSLKVDPHTGALAEGMLTFVITLTVLWVIIKGPSNVILKALLLSTSIVSVILPGAEYKGPSMNPTNIPWGSRGGEAPLALLPGEARIREPQRVQERGAPRCLPQVFNRRWLIFCSFSRGGGGRASYVINHLNMVRGKGMAAMYSWSCKRSYKNGFVWHDLSEDDLVLPATDDEYVLKGSELVDQSPSDRGWRKLILLMMLSISIV
uniref:SOSEKI DIX-like domain-containing protein n=1 Tax=Zea mays TaxID=4577 RepID=A0A804U937_MAIZE